MKYKKLILSFQINTVKKNVAKVAKSIELKFAYHLFSHNLNCSISQFSSILRYTERIEFERAQYQII